jgi:DNA invertase Pin-like site-specific DNA recombinase
VSPNVVGKENGMRAGIYARVSSDEQVEGFSLDAQRRATAKFCIAPGWRVVEE